MPELLLRMLEYAAQKCIQKTTSTTNCTRHVSIFSICVMEVMIIGHDHRSGGRLVIEAPHRMLLPPLRLFYIHLHPPSGRNGYKANVPQEAQLCTFWCRAWRKTCSIFLGWRPLRTMKGCRIWRRCSKSVGISSNFRSQCDKKTSNCVRINFRSKGDKNRERVQTFNGNWQGASGCVKQ